MQVNLISCIFVLDNEKNNNIRKNDIKKLKILVDQKQSLPEMILEKGGMKQLIKKQISKIIGSNQFHLEQVFTFDSKNGIDITYLGITNIENIKKLDPNYQLMEFKIEDNNKILFGNKTYPYKTIEIEENNNIEYIHEIKTKNNNLKKTLLNLLVSYKKIRNNVDNTDILFKFMGSSFTLEEVRILYELIKNITVDKSNFRKKIMKYCEKIDQMNETQKGFRPSQKYRFKPLKGDLWI